MLCLALTLQMSTLVGLKFDLWAELVRDFIGVLIGVLRTHALREARRDGSRCDQETQTEATMVFEQISKKKAKSARIYLREASVTYICSLFSRFLDICPRRWR